MGDIEAVLRGRLAWLSLEEKAWLLTGADVWSAGERVADAPRTR
jgi:hypothetical protein